MNRKIIMSIRIVKLFDDDGKTSIAVEIPRSDGSNELRSLYQFPDCDIENAASVAYDIIMESVGS